MKKRRSKAGETLVETLVSVTAEGAGSGTSQKTGRRNITLYTTDNGYQYYTDTTSSGVTP